MGIVIGLLLMQASSAPAVTYLDGYSSGKSVFLCKGKSRNADDFRLSFSGTDKAMTFVVEPLRGGKWPKEKFTVVHPVQAMQLVPSDWKANPVQTFRVTTGPLGHVVHQKNANLTDINFDMWIENNTHTKRQRMTKTGVEFYPGPDGAVTNKTALFSGKCHDPDSVEPSGDTK
jgi:hypothetical protein